MQASGIGRSFAVLLLLLAPPAALAADIAVLLPQTGRMSKAADAIRDGLMAAYYQDSTTAADSPVLHFYDSDADSPLGLIQKARTAGADFIIGPLDRERVEAVIKAGPPPVPVLALNNAPGHADNLLKFALSPEDEVARLVAWMHDQGIRRPLLLSAGDESSQRQLRLFQSAWQPGRTEATPAVVILDPARKGGIAMAVKGLATNISNRADALFLASPALARQVQPALTYYHIHVPLYSLSSAWDPTADPSGQNDLDGLHFCDLPWMLDTPRPEQQALYAAQPRPVAGYDRLYAFGADAWSVARSWSSLLNGEARSLRSGWVRLDADHNLQRNPACAEVRNGSAVLVWSPAPPADPFGGGR